MWRWLRKPTRTAHADPDEHLLELTRQIQTARLDLADRDRTIERLRAAAQRAESAAEQAAEDRVRAELGRLVTAIGTPLTQLVTQQHLHAGGAQLPLGDVLAVGGRLVRALDRAGVRLVGAIGEEATFDADRHESLGGAAPGPGQRVTIRVVGLSYRDTVLRKAAVEAVAD